MDSKLVLSVIFVTLCWGCMGTYAQTTTNGTMTTDQMATGNMTTDHMTTGHMTTGHMATGNMTAGNMAAGNMTAAPSLTTAAPTTAAPTTAAPTTAAPTTAASTTAAPTTAGTTAALPVSPNTTVVLLETPVSRADCGTSQLCAAEPADCDPSVAGSCFFLAAKQQSGQNFEFSLSGESEGYIAASVAASTTPGATDPTYVCANNNGVVQFFGTVFNNGQLVERNLSVTDVRGRVSNNQIQCTFTATIPDPLLTRTRSTGFSLGVATGSFNAAAGTLGTPTTVLRTPVVNLADPNATVVNQVNTTSAPTTAGNSTTASMTTAHAVIHQQSLIPALLFTLAVLLFTTQGGN